LTSAEVEAELREELARIIARESDDAGFEIATLARHRNAARDVIERRFSVRLKHEPSPGYEITPHSLDSTWLSCVDQGMRVAAARARVSLETMRAGIADLPDLQDRILRYARKLQGSLAKGTGILPVV
jgi:hypothetical protein